MKKKISWIPALLLTGQLFSCSAMTVYRNYQDGEFTGEPAVLNEQGYRFWLHGAKKELHDELRLVPGDYMIGFVDSGTHTGGAAYCSLETGNTYSFRITGRQYLPETGVFALLGECFYDPERTENLPEEIPDGDKNHSVQENGETDIR